DPNRLLAEPGNSVCVPGPAAVHLPQLHLLGPGHQFRPGIPVLSILPLRCWSKPLPASGRGNQKPPPRSSVELAKPLPGLDAPPWFPSGQQAVFVVQKGVGQLLDCQPLGFFPGLAAFVKGVLTPSGTWSRRRRNAACPGSSWPIARQHGGSAGSRGGVLRA